MGSAYTENGIYHRHTSPINRYSWYLEELDDALEESDLDVLDVGCAEGKPLSETVSRLEPRGYSFDAYAVEPSRKHADSAYERGNVGSVSRAAVQDLPYRAGSFDLVICHRVLPFLDSDDRLEGLDEIHRVLDDGGVAVVDLLDREEPDTRIVDAEQIPGLKEEAGEHTGDRSKR